MTFDEWQTLNYLQPATKPYTTQPITVFHIYTNYLNSRKHFNLFERLQGSHNCTVIFPLLEKKTLTKQQKVLFM